MDQTTPTQSIEPESVDAAAANQEIVSLFSRELVSVRAKLRDADRRVELAEALAAQRANENEDLAERYELLSAENRRLKSGGVKKEEPAEDDTELLRGQGSSVSDSNGKQAVLVQRLEEATQRTTELEEELENMRRQNEKLQHSKDESTEKYRNLKYKGKATRQELESVQSELEIMQRSKIKLEKKHEKLVASQQEAAPFSVKNFIEAETEHPRYLTDLVILSKTPNQMIIPDNLKKLLISPTLVLYLSDVQVLWQNSAGGNTMQRAILVIPPSCLDITASNGRGRWYPDSSLPGFTSGKEYDLFFQLNRGWLYPGVYRCVKVLSCSFEELVQSFEDQKGKCMRVRNNVIEKTFLNPSLVPPAIRNVVKALYTQALLLPTVVALEAVPEKSELALALAKSKEERDSPQTKQQGKRKRTDSIAYPPVVKRARDEKK